MTDRAKLLPGSERAAYDKHISGASGNPFRIGEDMLALLASLKSFHAAVFTAKARAWQGFVVSRNFLASMWDWPSITVI